MENLTIHDKAIIKEEDLVQIRDNIVIFNISYCTSTTCYRLVNGEFVVKDHAVTSGQPIDVKNGDTLTCGPNGEFNFRVGRHESTSVADWFNRQCNTQENTTFGHPAETLNFAFLGTLKLAYRYLGETTYNVTFNDILIAQDGAGASNNWWFGGKFCLNIKSNKVQAIGTAEKEDNFIFTFLRGGSNGNTVIITHVNCLTWMNRISDDKLLSQINIPGTHDSGTYNYSTPMFSSFVTTQNLTIDEQLYSGIRFLDIRCRHVNDTFEIYHGSFSVGLTFSEVLLSCKSFLNSNQSESIIMSIKEEDKPERNTRAFYKTFLTYADSTNTDYWYRGNTIPQLKDARKKIILFYRFDFEENAFGIDCNNWNDNDTFEIKNTKFSYTLDIQDKYDTAMENKASIIRTFVEKSNQRQLRHWYLNFVSLAPSVYYQIPQISKYENKIMREISALSLSKFLGTVIMDYPNETTSLINSIIDHNVYT